MIIRKNEHIWNKIFEGKENAPLNVCETLFSGKELMPLIYWQHFSALRVLYFKFFGTFIS